MSAPPLPWSWCIQMACEMNGVWTIKLKVTDFPFILHGRLMSCVKRPYKLVGKQLPKRGSVATEKIPTPILKQNPSSKFTAGDVKTRSITRSAQNHPTYSTQYMRPSTKSNNRPIRELFLGPNIQPTHNFFVTREPSTPSKVN